MRIKCVGGGPAGLYFALLMKLRNHGHDIVVYERGRADSTYGWGVTLGRDVIETLYRYDAASAQEIERAAFHWQEQVVHFRGELVADVGNDVYNVGRQIFLDTLAARARALGVDVRYGCEMLSLAQLGDADLIVVADGASSRIRHTIDTFKTNVSDGSNKYIWLATDKMFSSFSYLFTPTDFGWIWAYGYGFASNLSTFIIECAPVTWDGLGFATMSLDESLVLLESLFKVYLDGHQLMGRFPDGTSARWQNYRTITNQHWHDCNVVLLGDSAHTAHFSIGHGTKLALEDAIALADSLRSCSGVREALMAYESQRQADLVRPLGEARCSAQWFENLPRYAALEPRQFATLLHLRRSPLLPVLPPRLSFLLHQTTERSTALDRVRERLGSATKVVYSRRKMVRPDGDQATR